MNQEPARSVITVRTMTASHSFVVCLFSRAKKRAMALSSGGGGPLPAGAAGRGQLSHARRRGQGAAPPAQPALSDRTGARAGKAGGAGGTVPATPEGGRY